MTGITGPTERTGVYFWARSGGGHRTAKEGLKEQKIKEYHEIDKSLTSHLDVDITGNSVLSSIKIPFLGGLGDLAVNAWDNAQKRGDIGYLLRHASLGWIAEFICYPIVYFRVKWLLQDLKVEPEFLISTQAFCISAIVSAMRAVNHERKWNMHMHVHLTDLPSKKAVHFFPSMRKVADYPALRELVTLHAAPPITKNGQTEAEFWEKYCGKIKVITGDKFPLQKAFIDTAGLKEELEKPESSVKIKLNNPEESAFIQQGLSETCEARSAFREKEVELKIKKDDKLAFLMLGSVPTEESVKEWLDNIVLESEHADRYRQHYFFMYCGKPSSDIEKNELLPQVNEKIKQLKAANKLPMNFSIIPFSYQSDDVIAFMMARSDLCVTRSGGLTSMQLLAIDRADLPKRENKKVLIHSEAQLFKKTLAKDPVEFVKTIASNVATHLANKRIPTSPEWQDVKEKMLKQCISLGYTKEQSQTIVDNILDSYMYKNPGAINTMLEEVFLGLEKQAELLSDVNISSKKSINEQIKKMQLKSDYKGFDLEQLRILAIERILIKKGIVLWEGGNAKYLCKKMGGHIVNPASAKPILRNCFFAG
jgi:hypothetical protein